MHSSIAQTTALWFIVYLILAAIVIAISNVPSPTRNPKKVNIAETPESHDLEHLKDIFFGSTKFVEFWFSKINFENFESEISKIFENVLFYLAFY